MPADGLDGSAQYGNAYAVNAWLTHVWNGNAAADDVAANAWPAQDGHELASSYDAGRREHARTTNDEPWYVVANDAARYELVSYHGSIGTTYGAYGTSTYDAHQH